MAVETASDCEPSASIQDQAQVLDTCHDIPHQALM